MTSEYLFILMLMSYLNPAELMISIDRLLAIAVLVSFPLEYHASAFVSFISSDFTLSLPMFLSSSSIYISIISAIISFLLYISKADLISLVYLFLMCSGIVMLMIYSLLVFLYHDKNALTLTVSRGICFEKMDFEGYIIFRFFCYCFYSCI